MARQLESVFDTQLDAIAVALTAMYKDTVLGGVAADLADPRHPLRKYEDLLSFDAATGIYTTNTVALSVAYGNKRPTVSQADKDDKWTDPPA
jgi:hypothetical protein